LLWNILDVETELLAMIGRSSSHGASMADPACEQVVIPAEVEDPDPHSSLHHDPGTVE
jgi:hypothetical protein